MSSFEVHSVEPEYGVNYDAGWLGFTYSRSVISRGISFFTGFNRMSDIRVAHAFIVKDEFTGLEAHMGKVFGEFALSTYFDNPNIQVFFKKPREYDDYSADMLDSWLPICLALRGQGYDSRLIGGHFFRGTLWGRLLAKFGCWPDFINDPKRLICSEATSIIHRAYSPFEGRGCYTVPSHRISPQLQFEDVMNYVPYSRSLP